jgi:hypothetical protein
MGMVPLGPVKPTPLNSMRRWVIRSKSKTAAFHRISVRFG